MTPGHAYPGMTRDGWHVRVPGQTPLVYFTGPTARADAFAFAREYNAAACGKGQPPGSDPWCEEYATRYPYPHRPPAVEFHLAGSGMDVVEDNWSMLVNDLGGEG